MCIVVKVQDFDVFVMIKRFNMQVKEYPDVKSYLKTKVIREFQGLPVCLASDYLTFKASFVISHDDDCFVVSDILKSAPEEVKRFYMFHEEYLVKHKTDDVTLADSYAASKVGLDNAIKALEYKFFDHPDMNFLLDRDNKHREELLSSLDSNK